MIHGMYVIDKVTHTHTELFSDGAARKIEFSLSLSGSINRWRPFMAT
jgi:phage protein U